MPSIHSIAQSARHAHTGLHRALDRLDDVARTVEQGIKPASDDGGTFAEQFAALARMPRISLEARTNMRVLNTIEDLDAELLRQPRR